MGIIKVMDEVLANKIAAGEVIERVASVVKELVENSIDADSTIIKVELVESGTREIKVTDDGVGMDSTDALLAFTTHATSKIKTENDLFFINTLGFRGEALASIASVSEVELITCKDNIGTKIVIKGGKLITNERDSARIGTSISIKNLFFNTPARLKFLKSLNTELNNCVSYIERLSLSKPNISFSLSNNGKEIIKTSGSNDLHKTIHEIYGFNTSKNMTFVESMNDDYEIKGYISNINIYKSNRNNMITIVNGRIVNNPGVIKTIKEAYHTFLPDIKYPVVVLNIETDPTLLDVNIHPTKQDIKFSKTSSLTDLLYTTIRSKLKKSDNTFNAYKGSSYTDSVKEEFRVSEKSTVYEENSLEDVSSVFENSVVEQTSFLSDDEPTKNMIHPVGLSMGTYLFANDNDNIYIIDIHAANERINYEVYHKRLIEQNIDVTAMLIPISMELTAGEYLSVMDNIELFENLGIKVEEFGINTIRILTHPTWLISGYETESIKRIIDLVIEFGSNFDRVKFNDRLAMNLACKMSVKANNDINTLEQEKLIDRLFKCQFPYTCPHGRPTMIKYTKYEMEVLFKRVMN